MTKSERMATERCMGEDSLLGITSHLDDDCLGKCRVRALRASYRKVRGCGLTQSSHLTFEGSSQREEIGHISRSVLMRRETVVNLLQVIVSKYLKQRSITLMKATERVRLRSGLSSSDQ